MSTKSRKIIIVLLLAVVLAFGVWFRFFRTDNATAVAYPSFLEQAEAGKVERAEFSQDRITFVLKSSGERFYTENPHSDSLEERLLLNGVRVKQAEDLAAGTSVALDIVFDIIFFSAVGFGVYKLLSYSRKTFRVVHKTGVTFADIAGMDRVKKEMLILSDVLKNPSKYEKSGIRPVKGVILEGPPGNGKTLFAKALASECNVNFIATRGADFQSAIMSIGPAKIKALFAKAQRNRPCIVFIDEFDGIGERRNYAGSGIDKENNRIITAMLNEMDGFSSKNGILVIGATNSFASLDPALVRPGRFDLKYTVGNPDPKTREDLFSLYTKNKTVDADLDVKTFVRATEDLSCSAIESLLNNASSLSGNISRQSLSEAASRMQIRLKA